MQTSMGNIGARQRSDAASLGDMIEHLHQLDANGLGRRWRALIGGAIPKDLGRPLVLRILAYQLQAQRFGDLDTASKRELSTIYSQPKSAVRRAAWLAAGGKGDGSAEVGPSASGSSAVLTSRCARPGTLLSREHGGVMQRVMVLDEGVSWNGRTYESLSKVAFAITGTRWNGPRFFGLRDKGTGDRKATAKNEPPSQIIGRGRAELLTRSQAQRPST